jgi:hypothetical protein
LRQEIPLAEYKIGDQARYRAYYFRVTSGDDANDANGGSGATFEHWQV